MVRWPNQAHETTFTIAILVGGNGVSPKTSWARSWNIDGRNVMPVSISTAEVEGHGTRLSRNVYTRSVNGI